MVLRAEEEKETSEEPAGEPPAGYGTLPQEAIVRAVITDSLTGFASDHLIDERRRHRVERSIAEEIERRSDVAAERVIFTDLVVQ